jgi:hypothetical protein
MQRIDLIVNLFLRLGIWRAGESTPSLVDQGTALQAKRAAKLMRVQVQCADTMPLFDQRGSATPI